MNKRQYILLIIILSTQFIYADEGDNYLYKQSMNHTYFLKLYSNPATKIYSFNSSNWEISSGFSYNKIPKRVEDGDKTSVFHFNTNSFIKKTDELYYGSLRYNKGKKRNVMWSESSDNNIIYPYVLADNYGGDINSEEYYFMGGFSRHYKVINYGIEASYRANYEYRIVDPRPNNVVSQYSIKLGGSVNIFQHYIWGFGTEISRYNQENKLNNFKQNSTQKLFIMKGFGIYDRMFSKTSDKISMFYEKNRWECSMQLFSKNRSGFLGNLSFSRSNLDVGIDDFNDIIILNLGKNIYKIELGYFYNNTLLSKLYLEMEISKGLEKIYEIISFNNYKYITAHNNYSSINKLVGSSFLLCIKDNKYNIGLDILYKEYNQKYITPYCNEEISNLNSTLRIEVNNTLFYTQCYLGYSKNIKSSLILNNTVIQAPNVEQEMIIPNYNNLSSSRFYSGISTEFNYALIDKSLFIRGNYAIEQDVKKRFNSYIEISCGIKFNMKNNEHNRM